MRASAIRQLASARNASRVAAAYVDYTVEVWDVPTLQRFSQFDTVYTFGGHRITLNPSGETCVAAAWKQGMQGGIACYESLTGSVIWHRADIRHAQSVRFSSTGETVWCGVDDGPAQQLDTRTGETVTKLTSIERVFDSPYADLLLLDRRCRSFVLKGKREVRLPRLTFGLLDAQFSPDSICLSEAGGPVRCVNTESGAERWRYEPPKTSHVLRLGYRPADCCFYGVLWEFERGTSRQLIRFSAEDGHPQELRQLRSWEEEFCVAADVLVAANGEVISLSDGSLIAELAFPQKDYPDGPVTV